MAWCRQATNHYLSQCWPSSMSPSGVTRPQWVKNALLWHCTQNTTTVCYQNTCTLLVLDWKVIDVFDMFQVLWVLELVLVNMKNTCTWYKYLQKYKNPTLSLRCSWSNACHEKQGKSEGFDSCDPPSNLTQIVLFHNSFSPSWEQPEQRISAYKSEQPTAGCIIIFHKYKTWGYYNKFDSIKSLRVCYWYVKIPQINNAGIWSMD